MILEKIKIFSNFIKFEHSLFALPFALSAYLLVIENNQFNLTMLLLIIVALIYSLSFVNDINIENKFKLVFSIINGAIIGVGFILYSFIAILVYLYIYLFRLKNFYHFHYHSIFLRLNCAYSTTYL